MGNARFSQKLRNIGSTPSMMKMSEISPAKMSSTGRVCHLTGSALKSPKKVLLVEERQGATTKGST